MNRIFITALVFSGIILSNSAVLFAEEYKVSMKNWEFTPDNLTIRAGDSVLWVNDDDSHHKLIFEAPSLKGSENIKPEKEYRTVFDQPGEYKYYCKYHHEYGMHGTIVVKRIDE